MSDEPELVPLYLRATQGEIDALDKALELETALSGSVQKLNRTVWCRTMIRELVKKHGLRIVEPSVRGDKSMGSTQAERPRRPTKASKRRSPP